MTPKRPGTIIVYLSLAFTAILFLLAKDSLGSLGVNPIKTGAQITALLGSVLFSVSFVLATRLNILEEAFGGLDKVYRFHHKTGVWSFSFLAIHFLATFLGAVIIGVPFFKQLVSNPVFITGAISLISMTAIILTIIFAKIPYQIFVSIQKLFAIPLIFGTIHMFIAPSDISRFWPLGVWMGSVMFAGAASWIYRELLYKRFAPHAQYTITEVILKGADIIEVKMHANGKQIKYSPGQFAYFSFKSKNVSSEPHPFSFSSSPESDILSFAAKNLGDFTSTLQRAEVGDTVMVYGPHGRFFADLKAGSENIFIAGGIGITPFLSMVRGKDNFGQTMLFYSTNNETEAVFEKELTDLSEKTKNFDMFFHEANRRGFLTADIIEKRAGGLSDKNIYLCGPTKMMKALSTGFLAKGVLKSRIIFEEFSY